MTPPETADTQLSIDAPHDMQFDNTCSDSAPVEQPQTNNPGPDDEPQLHHSTWERKPVT